MDINGTPLTTARAIQMTVGGGIAITIFVLSGGWPEGWMDVFAFGCGKVTEGHIDCDPLLSFGSQSVRQ